MNIMILYYFNQLFSTSVPEPTSMSLKCSGWASNIHKNQRKRYNFHQFRLICLPFSVLESFVLLDQVKKRKAELLRNTFSTHVTKLT